MFVGFIKIKQFFYLEREVSESLVMRHLWTLRTFVDIIVIVSLFRFTSAGDFAIIADLNNGTIYAGSMDKRLSDLAPLPLTGVKRPVAVDYDPVEEMIYWTDLNSLPTPKISRAHLNGSNQMTVVDSLHLPDGLALDVESRMLYWTDGTLNQIGRIAMDGSGNKEIIVDGLDKPRSIVIDHGRGHIYWTEWGATPMIERADFDGNNRMTIIDGDLVWPNGVTIDFRENKLYWCDAQLDLIEKSDLSGANRQLVVNISGINGVEHTHPFDLVLYKDDNLYWTDWIFLAVLRIHKSGLGAQLFGPRVFEKAGGIHIQEESNYCDSTPCQMEGTCENVINGFTCHCPPRVYGLTCSQEEAYPCSSTPCLNGGSCVDVNYGSRFDCTCLLGYEGTTCEIVAGCVINPDHRSAALSITPDKDVFLPGENVRFDCSDGYELSGSTERFCRADRTWSGQPVECTREDPCNSSPCANEGTCTDMTGDFSCQCPAEYSGSTCLIVAGCVINPDHRPADLSITPDKDVYLPGENVRFDCSDGYELIGSTERFCRADRTWTGQPAECNPEDPCNSSPCANEGTCTDMTGDFSCQCPAEYSGSTCLIVAGCVINPDHRSAALSITPDKDVFIPGENVRFDCSDEFEFSGSSERLCRADYSWTGQPAECTIEVAGCVINPDHRSDALSITPDRDVFLPGEIVRFDCSDGYELSGLTERVCRADYSWSGQPAECTELTEAVPVAFIAGGAAGGLILIVVVVLVVRFIYNRTTRNGGDSRVTVEGTPAHPPPEYAYSINPTYQEGEKVPDLYLTSTQRETPISHYMTHVSPSPTRPPPTHLPFQLIGDNPRATYMEIA